MKKKKRKVKIKSFIILFIIIGLIILGIVLFLNKDKNTLKESNLIIEINGDKEITINYGEEYNDLGASAKYKDEDITNNIVTSNDLDLEKIGTYTYTYKIEYENLTKEIKRTVKVVDTINPTIELNGSDSISIYNGSKYNEQGAKAEDNYDKDLIDSIEITGNVDTSKNGEYKIVYKVKDSSNNEASVTRTVKVVEKPKETQYTSNGKSEIVGTTSKGYTIEVRDGITYIDGILIANKTYKLPSTYNPGGLLKVFNDNFSTMQSDAKKAGINISVISGYRSYSRQESIYNNYVRERGKADADAISARPGHSEHQSGLAADINSLSQAFENTKEGKWLNDNCYKYGFIIRYNKGKEEITGYIFEPWHIRYVGKDLAEKLYNNGNWISMEEYFGIDSKYD